MGELLVGLIGRREERAAIGVWSLVWVGAWVWGQVFL